MDRRTFISTTTAVGTSFVAGCGGGSTDGDATDSTVMASSTGTFRLLISDRPADIGDFDSLDVTFDRARVFRATSGGTETAVNETGETDGEETEPETDEAAEDEADSGEETGEDENDEDGDGGFEVFDLDSPTVDLTEVVGEKAIGVLDGELETGRYSKVELYVSDVEGVVDGETVPVKVPSEKLQIVKPFEIVADEAVEFVFDINVVEKGPNGYNLLPVISESGVAGKDVEVEEVESEETTATDDATTESDSSQ